MDGKEGSSLRVWRSVGDGIGYIRDRGIRYGKVYGEDSKEVRLIRGSG